MKTKTCLSCKQVLSITSFHKDPTRKDGFCIYCKDCKNNRFKKYRKENPEKMKENDKYDRIRTRRYMEKLRLCVLTKLFDPPKCDVCNISDIRILDIDHIDGGGTKERKQLSSAGVWRKIIKMDQYEAKQKYRILCKNCNWIAHLNRKS